MQWFLIPQIAAFLIDSCSSKHEWNPIRIVTWINTKFKDKPIQDDHFIESKYKIHNDATSFTYANGEVSMRYIATSTKLLAWIRFQTLNFNVFQTTCEYFLKKIFGNTYTWYEVYFIYFKDNNHPCVKLIHEYYLRKNGAGNSIIQ